MKTLSRSDARAVTDFEAKREGICDEGDELLDDARIVDTALDQPETSDERCIRFAFSRCKMRRESKSMRLVSECDAAHLLQQQASVTFCWRMLKAS